MFRYSLVQCIDLYHLCCVNCNSKNTGMKKQEQKINKETRKVDFEYIEISFAVFMIFSYDIFTCFCRVLVQLFIVDV
jgi:hypothetical protein